MSCSVGGRHGSDPLLLWLWCRLAAVVPIRPLAWETLYAVGAALKRKKKKKKTLCPAFEKIIAEAILHKTFQLLSMSIAFLIITRLSCCPLFH